MQRSLEVRTGPLEPKPEVSTMAITQKSPPWPTMPKD